MDAGGELIFYIIKFGALLVSIIGIIRLWFVRNDNRKHLQTKVFTLIATIISIALFTGEYNQSKKRMNELAGVYKVENFKCEKCIECNATLIKDGTYKLEQNNKILDSGKWSFEDIEFDAEFLRTDLIFDGQRVYGRELDSTRVIANLENTDCRN